MDGELEVTLGVDQRFGAPCVDIARERVVAVFDDPGVLLEAPDLLALCSKGGDVFFVAVVVVGAVALTVEGVVVSL